MRAVLRRAPRDRNGDASGEVLEVGDVALDPERHEVVIRGEHVQLPLKEFELLELLLDNAGRVLTRETLIDRVWGSRLRGRHEDARRAHQAAPLEGGGRSVEPHPDRHDPRSRATSSKRRGSPAPAGGSYDGLVTPADGVPGGPARGRDGGEQRPVRRPLVVTPFARLARTHALMAAGDAVIAIALAGSLFFDISPGAARTKVALYLLFTMLPFTIVAPLVGPAIDRMAGGRRAIVVACAGGQDHRQHLHDHPPRRAGAVPPRVHHARAVEGVRRLQERARAEPRAQRRGAGGGQLEARPHRRRGRVRRRRARRHPPAHQPAGDGGLLGAHLRPGAR